MNKKYFTCKLHFVWATNRREPILNCGLRKELFNRIREICLEKGYHLDHIGGYYDHIHILIGLESLQSPAQFVKDVKGISSRWINKNHLTNSYFSWQRGFALFSVSPSNLDRVRKYIQNQELHHQHNKDDNIEGIY